MHESLNIMILIFKNNKIIHKKLKIQNSKFWKKPNKKYKNVKMNK